MRGSVARAVESWILTDALDVHLVSRPLNPTVGLTRGQPIAKRVSVAGAWEQARPPLKIRMSSTGIPTRALSLPTRWSGVSQPKQPSSAVVVYVVDSVPSLSVVVQTLTGKVKAT